jgi:hypothetical protein
MTRARAKHGLPEKPSFRSLSVPRQRAVADVATEE